MTKFLSIKKNKRLTFVSKYNVKLYKKSLSLKLLLNSKKKQGNYNRLMVNLIKPFQLKCIYARNERVPLRLLKFFFLINTSIGSLAHLKTNFFIAQKLSVYNGKLTKFINTNSGLLEVTLKCGYRFGDLIFTRARYRFRKKKKKKK